MYFLGVQVLSTFGLMLVRGRVGSALSVGMARYRSFNLIGLRDVRQGVWADIGGRNGVYYYLIAEEILIIRLR